MSIKKLPPLKYLLECFLYLPESGQLYWKARPRKHFSTRHSQNAWNAHYENKEVGAVNTRGYKQTSINDVSYYVHRIVWKLATGKNPPKTIDHVDRDKANNRWNNLRAATASQNLANRGLDSRNSVGLKGVRKHKNGWIGQVTHNYKNYYAGCYKTAEEAAVAREKMAKRLHGEFA